MEQELIIKSEPLWFEDTEHSKPNEQMEPIYEVKLESSYYSDDCASQGQTDVNHHCEDEYSETEMIDQQRKCGKVPSELDEVQQYSCHQFLVKEKHSDPCADKLRSREISSPEVKRYECELCKKRFQHRFTLTRHFKVHSAEKPFQCTVCHKCFSHSFVLAKHLKTHSAEKAHKCEHCEKCFSELDHLVSHIRSHTGEKPFQCDECSKGFSRHSSLRKHRKIHSGERPFKCAECPKCFAWSSDLIVHLRTHTGDKPYRCKYCDKRFIRTSNLIAHLKTHE